MQELHSVVLTGAYAITALGDWTLHDGVPDEQADAPRAIETFQLEHYLDSKKTYLDRCSALALAGCAAALDEAGVKWPIGEDGFGITLGTHLGCLQTMRGFWDNVGERGARLASPLLFSHSYFNTPISLCAIEFGLKGYHSTVCAGHASGLEAVRLAFDAIRLGHATAMLCGGVEALTPARAQCEPGEQLSEAAVFFVLERAAQAAERDAFEPLTLTDETFAAAIARRAEVRARFGDCGGAEAALGLAWQCSDA